MEGAERVCVSLSIGSVSGLKLLPVWEGPWHYEMEQGPQLLQRILRDMGLCERERERDETITNHTFSRANHAGIITGVSPPGVGFQ